MPGCCVRTGCEGSGRGPPGVGRDEGYAGRGGAGEPGRGGCAAGRAAPVACAAGRGATGGFGAGRWTTRGVVEVGSGGVGVVGRCSSMRSRRVGGTTRPAGAFLGAAAGAGAGAAAIGASTGAGDGSAASAGGGSSIATAGAGGASDTTTGSGSGAGGGAGSASSNSGSTASVSGVAATTGLAVFTRRGGGSAGAAGLTGSGAFLACAPFLPPLGAGVSAKMSPVGSAMLRWRASRSTNWRATTSSIVLEALFTSMP